MRPPALGLFLIHGDALLKPHGDFRLEPDKLPEDNVPQFMWQGGIEKPVGRGKRPDFLVPRGSRAVRPPGLPGITDIILGIVVNVDFGAVIPAPPLIPREPEII